MVEHFRNVSENYEIRIWYRDGGLIFLMFHDVSSSIMAARLSRFHYSLSIRLSNKQNYHIQTLRESFKHIFVYLVTNMYKQC